MPQISKYLTTSESDGNFHEVTRPLSLPFQVFQISDFGFPQNAGDPGALRLPPAMSSGASCGLAKLVDWKVLFFDVFSSMFYGPIWPYGSMISDTCVEVSSGSC